MVATLEAMPMAKAKAGRPKSGRDDVTVRCDSRIADQLRLVATFRRVSVAELLGELIADPLAKAYAAMVKGLEARGK